MRRKLFMVLLVAAMVLPMVAAKKEGTRIQDGVLTYSAGHYLEDEPIPVGYDPYGYNYQSHMFLGSYANAYLGRPSCALPPYGGDDLAYYQRLVDEGYIADVGDGEAFMATHNTFGTWPYRNVQLMMKWSDVWLSNLDRNDDGLLDRGCEEPYTSSAAEGAWLTNHQWGVNDDGTHWYYFVKIVAVPSDAYRIQIGTDTNGNPIYDGYWYASDGTVIGTIIWGSFAIIQQISNDPMYDEHGCIYNPPSPTGFGYYAP